MKKENPQRYRKRRKYLTEGKNFIFHAYKSYAAQNPTLQLVTQQDAPFLTGCTLSFKMLTCNNISLYFLCISLTHFPITSNSVHVPVSPSWRAPSQYRNSCSYHSPIFVLRSLSHLVAPREEQIRHYPCHKPCRTQQEHGRASQHLKTKYFIGYQA